MEDEVKIQLGVPVRHREAATALYCMAFEEKLAPFLGERGRAARFLAQGFAPDRAFVAFNADQLMGIAGFKVDGTGLFEPGIGSFVREYGWTAPVRMLGLLMMEREEGPNILLMDGIAVNAASRGQGIGTRLLKAVEAHAQRLNKQAIRLDVIDTNPGARRLYERFGFVPIKTHRTGPLKHLFSFQTSTEMHKPVAPQV